MNNRQEISVSGEANTASAAPSNEELFKRFGQANVRLGQAQQEAQADGQKRLEEVYRTFFTALKATNDDFQKRAQESYGNYLKALTDPSTQPASQKHIEELTNNYFQGGQKLAEDAGGRYQEAHATDVSALQGVHDEARNSGLDACGNYLIHRKKFGRRWISSTLLWMP